MTLNVGNEPTFVTSSSQEVLDLTLSSFHIAHLIKNWKVTNKVLTSDHRCITFHIRTDHAEYAKFRNPKWQKFNDQLSKALPECTVINSKSDLDNVADAFNKAMTNSFNISCPEKTIKASRGAVFFTSDLKKLRKDLRSAFNKAKPGRPNFDAAVINRRSTQKLYNKAIRKNQRSLLKQAYTAVKSTSASALLVKSLAKDPCCSIGTLKLPSGEYTEDASATLKHLLEYHFPGSSSDLTQSRPASVYSTCRR